MTKTDLPPRNKRRSPNPATVRTLDRGLAILEHLSTGDGHKLLDVSESVGLPLSTTYRLLEALVLRGFVQHDQHAGRYSIGIRAFEVGSRYVRTNVTEAALPAMRRLAERVNETVNMAVRDGLYAVYIQQIEGRQRVRMFTRVGARVPLYCTGVGKALLAWEEREILSELPVEQWILYTPKTHLSLNTLAEDLSRVSKGGIAVDDEEYETGIRCLAAPIRSHGGKVVAAVSVSAPLTRFDDKTMPGISQELLKCASEISSRLGWADI